MADRIEKIYGSTVQHGPHNDRIYILHLAPAQIDSLLPELEKLAASKNYGKIFAKIPVTSWQQFQAAGYIKEADIPCFYFGETACCFVAKFFAGRDRTEEDFSGLLAMVEGGNQGERCGKDRPLFNVEACTPADAGELSLIYRKIFATYPFPVFDAAYLSSMMVENVNYYCIRENNRIIAAAAAELNIDESYAEMTDFATLHDRRGKGLAVCLLKHMDREARRSGIATAFTIARASSLGMNRVFKNCGYIYSGLLVNNTQIGGSIQSMVVWYKLLHDRCS